MDKNTISLPDIHINQRIVTPEPPGRYTENDFFAFTQTDRSRQKIDFHIPHRKLLEKMEKKIEQYEPLTGFAEEQDNKIKKKTASKSQTTLIPIEKKTANTFYTYSKKKVLILPKVFVREEKETKLPYDIELKRKPNLIDMNEIIKKLKQKKTFDFVYLIYAVSKKSIYHSPYCLRVVPYDKINKMNYFTMSRDGILHFSSEIVFTALQKWEKDYFLFCRLGEIKFIKTYRMWKSFYLWRKTILFKKFATNRDKIQNSLFSVNVTLGKCLLQFREKHDCIFQENLVDRSEISDIPLFYFIENQIKMLEHVKAMISNFRVDVLPLIYKACFKAFHSTHFVVEKIVKMKYDIIDIKNNDGMSFTEKAKKKKFCERLINFVHLLDYIYINAIHHLMTVSYNDLAELLKSHYDRIDLDKEFNENMKELKMFPKNKQWPLFQIDIDITDDSVLKLNPSEEMTVEIFSKITTSWNSTIIKFQPFLSDPMLFDFTCPIISGKRIELPINMTEKSIEFILNQDDKLSNDIALIPNILKDSYESVYCYLKKYDTILNMNREDVRMDILSIDGEDLQELRSLCLRFNEELETNNNIPPYQVLGLFFICLDPMKTSVLTMPQKLFYTLSVKIPLIGRQIVKEVMEESESVMLDLNTVPESSIDLVDYNLMLNDVGNVVASLENKLDFIHNIYDLMDEYEMDISTEEMQDYLDLNTVLNTLRSNCQKKLQLRKSITQKFSSQIAKDINELMDEVQAIQKEVSAEWLLNINSKYEIVQEKLNSLMKDLSVCEKKYDQILEWKKLFKMPQSRLEILDEIIRNVQLRQILWKSCEDWNTFMKKWYECPFEILDMEEIQSTTINCGKTISQLDKGLPKNEILQNLRASVELLKSKLPTIGYLKNPSLKQRHWISIESILDTSFTTDSIVTLTTLEDTHIFDHTQELMEVSGQASSEASLEALLAKVEDMWKSLELPIIPYHDYKDIYILGGLDEIHTAIDESTMLISIILSSRNCTPIKSKVKEWERQLNVLSDTLTEWFQCMQTWMYLEVLFSAADIKRQLPNEARLFITVDKIWRVIMRKTAKMPLAISAGTKPELYKTFQDCNNMLDKIMKCLEAYLEMKRVSFPRFYFLSNDELLDILAQTRNPHAVQPHLRKCFDAIARLEFAEKNLNEVYATKVETTIDHKWDNLTTDIISMMSPESERVVLGKGLKARGNVEDWLSKVQDGMFAAVKKCMKISLKEYLDDPRTRWITRHPNQVVLTVSQIMWARKVHEILESDSSKVNAELAQFEKQCISDLNDLAEMTRQDLSNLFRKILCALITIDVHARDTISNMISKNVQHPDSFEWLKMIRYYWDETNESCVARMSSACQVYGYEYIGAGGVLVITPLTDRCYLCLMGALQLDLGGSPSGPAGTGKTETTKDLAKSLAVQCVVFNCSEGLDYKMMGRFFSGLVQSGAWCCFDEFNRINIEVLSVIAQQLIVIRNAKASKMQRFVFEGREVKLVPTCATFITMNPGYAGRTELPDNLKAVFRPISMMVPDYGLIAEVILYSEGFESSKKLSKKMVQLYKLCSEQLSQQDHYDFGMRAVKSVLVMAGALKRASPDQYEEVTLMCALRDSNLPKFLADDALLFGGILGDLFPGLEVPLKDYAEMKEVIELVFSRKNLQSEPSQFQKVIQLHETMIVRWGVMLVGPTGGGKTTILNVLGDTLGDLCTQSDKNPYFQRVHMYTMNPKSLTMGELYGEVNNITLEWKDGLLAIALRKAVKSQKNDHQWIVCDGPVDAVWIENMNTVLDDNKMLCLANSERIKLTPYVHMIFEVADLAQASPATVSRCGMVYIDPSEIRWYPIVRTWLASLPINNTITPEIKKYIYSLCEQIDNGVMFISKYCSCGINQVELGKAKMLCRILQSLLSETDDKVTDVESLKIYIFQCFLFSYTWAIGGNLQDEYRNKFEIYVKKQFEEIIDSA